MENKDKKTVGRKKGEVVSKSGDKTVIVAVDTFKTHSKYKKKYRSTKRYKVHDAENKCSIGDSVEIISCVPVSKDKKFKIVNKTENK